MIFLVRKIEDADTENSSSPHSSSLGINLGSAAPSPHIPTGMPALLAAWITVRIERTGTVFQLTNTYTGESGGESPSTGDTSVPMFMITLLSASGVIMILTGLVVRNRKEKQDV